VQLIALRSHTTCGAIRHAKPPALRCDVEKQIDAADDGQSEVTSRVTC
jgi:hypothetical protein